MSGVDPIGRPPWLEQEPRLEHAMGGGRGGTRRGRHTWVVATSGPDGGGCTGLVLAATTSQALVLAAGSSKQRRRPTAAAAASNSGGARPPAAGSGGDQRCARERRWPAGGWAVRVSNPNHLPFYTRTV